MYNSDTELLFPLRLIQSLEDVRGGGWQKLIQQVSDEGAPLEERMAFVYMMVRLGGCITCNADSFRAMKGCTLCARQTIRRYRGSDQELADQFQQARQEVEMFIRKSGSPIAD